MKRLHKTAATIKTEEDEEQDQTQRKRNKKKNKAINKYFEYEAEEGNEEDESVGGQQSHSKHINLKEQYYDTQELKRKTKGLDEKILEMEKRANRDEQLRKQRQGDIKDRAKMYDAEGNTQEDESEEEAYGAYEEEDEYAQNKKALLPSTADPKLW